MQPPFPRPPPPFLWTSFVDGPLACLGPRGRPIDFVISFHSSAQDAFSLFNKMLSSYLPLKYRCGMVGKTLDKVFPLGRLALCLNFANTLFFG